VPFALTVDAEGIGRYVQEIEAAVYFCCLEAFQNISKHAEASKVTVVLRGDEKELQFGVTDDGRGFDPSHTMRGAGLQNMLDRIDALDGTLVVQSSPGHGTTIAGRIPCQQVEPVVPTAVGTAPQSAAPPPATAEETSSPTGEAPAPSAAPERQLA
jgi:signal transduction histidine kinase